MAHGELAESMLRAATWPTSSLGRYPITLNRCCVYLDEVDTTTELALDYSLLFPILRWRRNEGKQIVFVLVGSGAQSVGELARKIESRIKGPDLTGFIPDDHRFGISEYSRWDRLLVLLSKMAAIQGAKGMPLTKVELFALYYVAVVLPNAKARNVSRLAEAAASRIADGVFRYDNLFDPDGGAQERGKFYSEHFSVAERLTDRFLALDD